MEFYLQREGPDDGILQTIAISNQPITIGRDKSSTIVMKGRKISKHQCTIRLKGKEVLISDRKSHNGTFVNDKRITNEAKVEVDNRIGFGVNPSQPSYVSNTDFVYTLKRTDKSKTRDDEFFSFKSTDSIDSGLRAKISDIISHLDDDDEDDTKSLLISTAPRIEEIILDKISTKLFEDKRSNDETKSVKRRRSDSPTAKPLKKIKLELPLKTDKLNSPQMWDEIPLKIAKSLLNKSISIKVDKLSTTLNKMFQTCSVSSLKNFFEGSRKRRRSSNVESPGAKRRKSEPEGISKSKVDKSAKVDNKSKRRRKEPLSLSKKSSVKSPKTTKKLSVSPTSCLTKTPSKKKLKDCEEFVEYRGAKLISDLVCSDDDSSEEEKVKPNHKRRYIIKLESTPANVKSILSPKENSAKLSSKKKLNFCSKVFIRNFIPNEAHHQEVIDLS